MNKFNVAQLQKLKQSGEKIACVTAYDASFSRHLEQSGVEIILVGDTLGVVVQGHATTVPVTVEHMVYHAQMVARGSQDQALRVVDMPFMSYTNVQQALDNAKRIMQDGKAHVVKLEGAGPMVDVAQHLTNHGVPVCAHLGLLPQSINKLGRYRVQGRQQDDAKKIIDDAKALEQAGADLLVLECIPQSLAKSITEELAIPVIGIGAGPHCDGQVLVLYDILGISHGHIPKFSKNFLIKTGDVAEAIKAFVAEVKSGDFPSQDHWYE